MQKILLTLLTLSAIAPAALAQIHASFTDGSVSITGATPNASVAVYALMHTFTDSGETPASFADIVPTDAAGAVHVAQQVAFQSIWVIVDIPTGVYAVATPPGFKPMQIPMPPAAVAPGGQSIVHPRPYVECFVVRPGVGAWHTTAASGRNGDEGAGPGRVRIALTHFKRAGTSGAAPDHLIEGDICFVADPDWLRYWIARLDRKTAPGVTNVP